MALRDGVRTSLRCQWADVSKMERISGLTVRQYERESLNFAMEFVIDEAHRGQVRFSSMSSAPEPHMTRGRLLDISSGGVGFVCPQFVPRMCEGAIRIFSPAAGGTARDGSPNHEMLFEHAVKVRRVVLESHEPTYSVGAAFVEPAGDIEDRVARLLASLPTQAGQAGNGHA